MFFLPWVLRFCPHHSICFEMWALKRQWLSWIVPAQAIQTPSDTAVLLAMTHWLGDQGASATSQVINLPQQWRSELLHLLWKLSFPLFSAPCSSWLPSNAIAALLHKPGERLNTWSLSRNPQNQHNRLVVRHWPSTKPRLMLCWFCVRYLSQLNSLHLAKFYPWLFIN